MDQSVDQSAPHLSPPPTAQLQHRRTEGGPAENLKRVFLSSEKKQLSILKNNNNLFICGPGVCRICSGSTWHGTAGLRTNPVWFDRGEVNGDLILWESEARNPAPPQRNGGFSGPERFVPK